MVNTIEGDCEIIQSWDIADSVDKTDANTVCLTIEKRQDGTMKILRMFRAKNMTKGDVKGAIENERQLMKPNKVLV